MSTALAPHGPLYKHHAPLLHQMLTFVFHSNHDMGFRGGADLLVLVLVLVLVLWVSQAMMANPEIKIGNFSQNAVQGCDEDSEVRNRAC
jgi:hypothetical protein